MTILVLGGTGTVGSATLAALAARGIAARGGARVPAPGGVAVDLRDPASVEAAAQGCDAALLITPVVADEIELGLNAVAALRRAGVRKIVQLAVMNPGLLGAVPHVANKLPVSAAVLASGVGVVLEPNFFMQNDELALPAIVRGGVFPLPIGDVGVWSVDAADLGEAAARALTRPDWDGQAVPLCGPECNTGEALAASWSAALGREVAYGGDAVEPFIAAIEAAMPMNDWLRDDLSLMMHVTQAVGCPATPGQQALSRALIGREPTTHAAYARGVAARQSESVR